jgi:hypothetical protein
MVDDLQELREQEDRAEHPEEHKQRGRIRQGEAAVTEQLQRQHRLTRPQFPADERRHEQRADDQGRQHGDAGPAVVVAADHAEHDTEQAHAGQDQARQVQAGGRIHCQDAPSTTAPPTSGPIAMARPPTAPQAPRASPRRCGDTAADSSVSVSGITMAAPTPWTARAATSHPMPGASAAAAEPAVNRPRPVTNIRLRPYRSPSVAPVSRSTAKVRV